MGIWKGLGKGHYAVVKGAQMKTPKSSNPKDYSVWCPLCGIQTDRDKLVTGAVQSICNECLAVCNDKTAKEANAHFVRDKTLLCSFCGPNKTPIDGTNICDQCVDLANEVLAERNTKNAT